MGNTQKIFEEYPWLPVISWIEECTSTAAATKAVVKRVFPGLFNRQAVSKSVGSALFTVRYGLFSDAGEEVIRVYEDGKSIINAFSQADEYRRKRTACAVRQDRLSVVRSNGHPECLFQAIVFYKGEKGFANLYGYVRQHAEEIRACRLQ